MRDPLAQPHEVSHAPAEYRDLAEASWRWVLGQVRWDDGPWIPSSVPAPSEEPPWDRDGLHSGIGGLALALAEIRLTRAWTSGEHELADAIADRVVRQVPAMTDPSFFDGLVSAIAVLIALDAPGADIALARLAELATPAGWPQTIIAGPRYVAGAPVNDATIGTAGVLLGAVWAGRHSVAGSRDLASRAADLLLAESEEHADGLDWPFIPTRYLVQGESDVRMPNYTHGLAGIATALAVAGHDLGRADLVDAAARGAHRLVGYADLSDGGFVVPRRLPVKDGEDGVTFNWCHGPAGTSLLFPALAAAGVGDVAGESTAAWRERCLTSVRRSGVPNRHYPGFWDNDGRCCGTAGVGDVFLDAGDVEFGLAMASTLLDRAVTDDTGSHWRFVEHRNSDPLLPPGTGWMQGAAGISAFLFRAARVADGGAHTALQRLDNFWCVPDP